MNKVILGKYVKIKTGKLDANASEENGKYPFFTCARVISRINTYAFDCECVLVAGNGELNVKYYEGKFNAYQRTYVIESLDHQVLSTKYLYYFIDSYMEKLRNGAIGGVIKYIKLNHLTDIVLPLPDLENQEKIVAILDKAKSLIEKRERTIEMFDELLRATFLDMFGDPFFNSKKFETNKLENVCSFITKGTTPKNINILEKPFDGSIPFLKVYHISDGGIDFHYKPSYISELIHKKDLLRSIVKPNDVLMNIVGPPLGKIGIVPFTFKEWNINQAIVIFRTKELILPEYLLSCLKSGTLLKSIIEMAVGVRQQNISLKQCRDIIIPIPPIELQEEFQKIYLLNRKCKSNILKSYNYLNNLISGLSQSAFNGELKFNTAVDLEVLLENDYAYFKDNADRKAIQLLLERLDKNELNSNKFYDQGLYDKAKSFVFKLLKEDKILQVFDTKTDSIKLTIK